MPAEHGGALVVARKFYYQEAAIDWLSANEMAKSHIESYLTVALRETSHFALHVMLMGHTLFPDILSSQTWKGVFYPKDLFPNMLVAELARRAREDARDDLFGGALIGGALGSSYIKQRMDSE